MPPYTIIIAALGIVIAGLVAYIIIDRRSYADGDGEGLPMRDDGFYQLPYYIRPRFMSSAEWAFYKALKEFLNDNQYVICNMISLKDIFGVEQGARHEKMFFNILTQKHVDFLICRTSDLAPIFAIEVDDFDIENQTIQERDFFFDSAFHCAGFPLVRIPFQDTYTQEELRTLLDGYETAVPVGERSI